MVQRTRQGSHSRVRSLDATGVFSMQGEVTLPKGGSAHRVGLPGSMKPPGAAGASHAPVHSMVPATWLDNLPVSL